jgi:hypothetical protein
MHGSERWRAIGAVTFAVAAFVLLSMGGAIVAAPITLPLMYFSSVHHPTRSFRLLGSVLAALTAAEVVWAGVYVAVEEAQPWIWLLPGITALVVAVSFARRVRRRQA